MDLDTKFWWNNRTGLGPILRLTEGLSNLGEEDTIVKDRFGVWTIGLDQSWDFQGESFTFQN